MSKPSLQLTQMTLATTHTLEMIKFYDTLFGTEFQAIQAYGTTLYRGTLAAIPLLLYPNEIAGVEAEQSRHQLALRVADLPAFLWLVETAGGTIDTPIRDAITHATIRDPDGNTLEVTQA